MGVNVSGAGALGSSISTTEIDDDAVTYAKMQNISATARLLGRNTAGAGDTEEVTPTQATAMLDAATATLKGLVPTPPNNTTTFLRGDATFAAAGSGAVTRVGGQTTEATTTSTTVVDLLSASALTGAADLPTHIYAAYRKTTGAANDTKYGLKLNTTVTSSTDSSGLGATGGANAAQSGYVLGILGPRITNYAHSALVLMSGTAATAVSAGGGPVSAADMPVAAITDVVIRSNVSDALITSACDELHVYTLATS